MSNGDSAKVTPLLYRQGPGKNRKCTDVICCVLFIGAWVCAFVFLIMNLKKDSLITLMKPMDSNNNFCGYEGYAQYSYLFFSDQNKATWCVSNCPNNTSKVDCKQQQCPNGYKSIGKDYICYPTENKQIAHQIHYISYSSLHSVLGGFLSITDSIILSLLLEVFFGILFIFTSILVPALSVYLFYIFGLGFLIGMAGIFIYQYQKHEIPQIYVQQDDRCLCKLIKQCLFFNTRNNTPSHSYCFGSRFDILQKQTQVYCLSCQNLISLLGRKCVHSHRTHHPHSCFDRTILPFNFPYLHSYHKQVLITENTTQSKDYHPYKHLQLRDHSKIILMSILVLILWTRGTMISLSNFKKTSNVTYWYFQQYFQNYSCFLNMRQTFYLCVCNHFGTIVFAGATIANIPSLLLTAIRKINQRAYEHSQKNGCLACCGFCFYYGFCCCGLFKKLNRFSYFQVNFPQKTILQNLNFLSANEQSFELNVRNKVHFQQVYNMANFLSNSAKLNLIIFTSFICFISVYIEKGQNEHSLSMILIIIFCIVLMADGVASFFFDGVVLTAQIVMLCYTVDIQIQRFHYGNESEHTCKDSIKQIIDNIKAQKMIYD